MPLPLKHSNPNPFFKQIDQHYIYKSINLKKKKKIVPISSFESLIKKKNCKILPCSITIQIVTLSLCLDNHRPNWLCGIWLQVRMATRQVRGDYSIPSPNPCEHPPHSYNFKSNKLNNEILKKL